MTASPKATFSICIPNYNHSRYLGETIQSVLDQTYPHFENIVADNASTDNSVSIVKSFRDDRIRLVENNYNIGFAPNLQRVTSLARNEFINLLSSDDLMLPDALETYAAIVMNQGDKAQQTVLFSDVEDFTDAGAIINLQRKAADGFYTEHVDPKTGSTIPSEVDFELYRGRDVLKDSLARLRTFAPFLSIVYPRRLWDRIEGYNGIRTVGPDKHFNYKLLSLDPDVVYVPRVLYRYRSYMSDNRRALIINLKQPIDDYLYTLELSDEFLNSLGLSRQQIIDRFIDTVCLKDGLRQVARHNYMHGLRLLAFAFASYPGSTLRKKKAYMLLSLLMLGPLASVLAPSLLTFYKSTTTARTTSVSLNSAR